MTAFITPLLPFIRDSFSLDYTKAGILMSAFNIVYGFSQLPTGLLADRFGSRTLIAVGISGVVRHQQRAEGKTLDHSRVLLLREQGGDWAFGAKRVSRTKSLKKPRGWQLVWEE